ncbi:hypothetical protein F8M41_018511 [Gigaspora margarita]|uniref:C2H2-type domain-containing protein n=1 Tax=Gigaspora margarita TaxID=4874 RepID=A0A8H4EL89_GIGMA|nr:hypothetical protein F8M41_018511 [Gigaspora margarita]
MNNTILTGYTVYDDSPSFSSVVLGCQQKKNYHDRRIGYSDYDRSPDLFSIAPSVISDQTTSVTVNYYDARPNDNILLNSSLIPSLQHVSHTFIPASYITERQPTSNVIKKRQLANNIPVPRQQLTNHKKIAGQQPARHIVSSGQQTKKNTIVPGHPPVIGHKKRGKKSIIYHKCIICKRECKSPKLLKEHNMIYHNLT